MLIRPAASAQGPVWVAVELRNADSWDNVTFQARLGSGFITGSVLGALQSLSGKREIVPALYETKFVVHIMNESGASVNVYAFVNGRYI